MLLQLEAKSELGIMLKSLKMENFRSFESFELKQLGRINLLVGENNSGKTSVLEAIQLLYSRTNLEPLAQTMFERGEFFRIEERKSPVRGDRELDIRHLFNGHCIVLDESFSVTAMGDFAEEGLIGKVKFREFRQETLFDSFEDDFARDMEFVLSWTSEGEPEELRIPLSIEGGMPIDYNRRIRPKTLKNAAIRMQFVTSSSVSVSKMIEMFDQVVLKPEEDSIVQALKNIDANIERIASLGTDRYLTVKRGGFVIKRQNEEQPVPIGSMGDGIWRMLGLALSTVCTKGGVLLVDEIDTGLHFTAMISMWKMILDTAKKLNVQVFVTTHSRDCWESLAEVAEMEHFQNNEIMIHRIEKGKSESVLFNPRQMAIAAEEGIEVR
jgi:energy-coupling factor transporter ATP-binding protein EcfA2